AFRQRVRLPRQFLRRGRFGWRRQACQQQFAQPGLLSQQPGPTDPRQCRAPELSDRRQPVDQNRKARSPRAGAANDRRSFWPGPRPAVLSILLWQPCWGWWHLDHGGEKKGKRAATPMWRPRATRMPARPERTGAATMTLARNELRAASEDISCVGMTTPI